MTNRLVGTSYIPSLSTSDHVDILGQLEDSLNSLASDISSIMSEWNAEAYYIFSSLPQGVSDTRWNLDNTINTKLNGLDGANMFVDIDAAATVDSGKYWDSVNLRPKTVKETLNNLYSSLSSEVNQVRTEITSVSSSGLTAAQMASIGDNIFDATKTSAASSLDGLTASNNLHSVQLAKDLYDQTSWSWTSDGSPLLNNYSVKDMVDALLALHNGAWDADISINHSGISGGSGGGDTYSFITAGTNEETSSSTDIVAGGFTFDPAEFTTSTAMLEVYFEGQLNYVAAGAAGTGSLKLYDMGAPGSTGPGVLRSTLERDHTGSSLPDRVRSQLTFSSSPGVDSEEVYDSARVYELRISVDGTGDISDSIKMTWGGFVIQPA